MGSYSPGHKKNVSLTDTPNINTTFLNNGFEYFV